MYYILCNTYYVLDTLYLDSRSFRLEHVFLKKNGYAIGLNNLRKKQLAADCSLWMDVISELVHISLRGK